MGDGAEKTIGKSCSVPHVCVVGAGISGLRCAAILLSRGIKVTILEARDRVGGRIAQSNELGYTVDIGPNWIHTSGENPILDLAKLTQTPLHIWNENVQVFDRDGVLVDPEVAKRLGELRWDILENAMKYSRENESKVDKGESLGAWFSAKAAETSLSAYEKDVLLGMGEMWGCYTGDSIHRQSLKYTWLEDCCGGEESIVASNFAAILAEIARVPLQLADVRLSEQLKHLTLQGEDGKRSLLLETDKGEKLTFDEVVMTTPLGWLKRHQSAFSPPLTATLVDAINEISVGHLEKVYITFPKAWWKAKGDTTYPGYTNWLPPKYAQTTNAHAWPQEAYDLAAFPDPHSHPTLLLYLYGDCSEYIATVAYRMPKEDQYSLLNAFFKPYYSLLPHYDEDSEECVPLAFLATSWRFDEFSGNGSYCNFQIGIDQADKHVQALQAGLPEKGLWFAGEHTAPLEEMGTATGAYLSGERVAKQIIDKYLL